jgi:hypothetical protein
MGAYVRVVVASWAVDACDVETSSVVGEAGEGCVEEV